MKNIIKNIIIKYNSNHISVLKIHQEKRVENLFKKKTKKTKNKFLKFNEHWINLTLNGLFCENSFNKDLWTIKLKVELNSSVSNTNHK